MQTLFKILCSIAAFGATMWMVGATPTVANLSGLAVGATIGYGIGWLGLRAFPRKAARSDP